MTTLKAISNIITGALPALKDIQFPALPSFPGLWVPEFDTSSVYEAVKDSLDIHAHFKYVATQAAQLSYEGGEVSPDEAINAGVTTAVVTFAAAAALAGSLLACYACGRRAFREANRINRETDMILNLKALGFWTGAEDNEAVKTLLGKIEHNTIDKEAIRASIIRLDMLKTPYVQDKHSKATEEQKTLAQTLVKELKKNEYKNEDVEAMVDALIALARQFRTRTSCCQPLTVVDSRGLGESLSASPSVSPTTSATASPGCCPRRRKLQI